MYFMFIYSEGQLIHQELVSETDLNATQRYYESQGYMVQVELDKVA